MLLAIVLSILIAIALGYITKINIGIYAIVFAYILGCYVLDLKSSQIIDLWPIKIFFIIFSVTLFSNINCCCRCWLLYCTRFYGTYYIATLPKN